MTPEQLQELEDFDKHRSYDDRQKLRRHQQHMQVKTAIEIRKQKLRDEFEAALTTRAAVWEAEILKRIGYREKGYTE